MCRPASYADCPIWATAGSNRGIALISVLLITGLLAVMAASFASSTRTEARLAHNHEQSAKAEALADAGVHRAVFKLLDFNPDTAWRADGTVHAFSLGEGDVQVWIEDEDGKIDLNGASLPLLTGLLIAQGLPEEDAKVMADRIGDFRDEDSEPEPLGAEDEAYLGAGLAQGAADQPFATESELLGVLGMTQSLYQQIRPTSPSIPALKASTRLGHPARCSKRFQASPRRSSRRCWLPAARSTPSA